MCCLKTLRCCGCAESIGGAVHAFPFPTQQERDESAKICSQTSTSVRFLSFLLSLSLSLPSLLTSPPSSSLILYAYWQYASQFMALHTIPSLPPANQRPKHHRRERERESKRQAKTELIRNPQIWVPIVGKEGEKKLEEWMKKRKDTKMPTVFLLSKTVVQNYWAMT